jgi:hypothetical protein
MGSRSFMLTTLNTMPESMTQVHMASSLVRRLLAAAMIHEDNKHAVHGMAGLLMLAVAVTWMQTRNWIVT